MYERPIPDIVPDLIDLPIEFQDNQYISEFFFEDPDVDGPALKKRWADWVNKNLRQYYHERSRITLYKEGLVQALRPGEISRCKANNMGIAPGDYEIIKKCRPTGQLDNLDWHAFRVPLEKIIEHCVDLDRPTSRIKDAALLYLINQYMYHNLQVRFTACFVKQEHQWSNDFDDLEKQEHPILLQTLGGWDVYCKGEVLQTRNLGKAFLVWCYKIASSYNGYIFGAISMMVIINELIVGIVSDMPKEPEESLKEGEQMDSDSYWI